MVSINIPTDKSISEETLESVKNQTYKDIELITIVTSESLSVARKQGIDRSKGEYIMLLDSDQSLSPDTIEKCVETCEQGYDGVTLFEKSKVTGNTFCERIIAYDKWLFHSLQDDDPIHGTAIPRFFRASILKKIDYPKNPPLTFEHSIIHNEFVKLGGKVKFINSFIYHNEPKTFRELFKKFKRYGYYYIPALKVDKNLVLHHSLPRRAYFTKKAFKHPMLWLGLIYHYGVKGAAAMVGITQWFFRKEK